MLAKVYCFKSAEPSDRELVSQAQWGFEGTYRGVRLRFSGFGVGISLRIGWGVGGWG